ncbi:hypothetical protein A3J43_03275 [Candidatus Uhrbacteria bacterium RIFCSPHIGHO2_12_FULL_54_23]|uniref:Adenine DNA glycosylase n=3 Tax=Candidatus Uhriibacteriota TaxID=1752732 RepID=A0A1F7UKM7_9BACT|nr:MAG: hypothetical protein A3J43_03275 [Candidatus Uhrbacteria bacterium RIFCSPHIGHO2_12_FULL_54_23]OGL83498.1 MAG: hypothetical protein A3B36_02360 [Candidatus Uhrbacteria bacterium RIFCSPLOWO2_01_FULL_55_36]OGL90169.1 MAG: hypothetical protein A3J36_01810 [Candidatus Uhrbacteria bacterium RIFCSPLOWO2_02_FULL_54_37]
MRWRKTRDPYKILVSEIMLQQTQVKRVEKFYPKFIGAFPNFRALARAPLKSVLKIWQGMGYNRRAMALKKIAQKIDTEYHGKLPDDIETLKLLPGIGEATASAVIAYAFNRPVAFVETNIRRVFIFYFFTEKHTPSSRLPLSRGRSIRDQEILKLVAQTLDRKNPRAWYWALMDYGVMLAAREKENPNTRSARYRKQSRFEGSRRQMRGMVLRLLLAQGSATRRELKEFQNALPGLLREGFIKKAKGAYRLV